MIINIRGTSGSGKTTLINKIRALYAHSDPIFIPKRKRPIRYRLEATDGSTLSLIGHYETACGGCDTITECQEVFNLIHVARQETDHVLFEGLLIAADVNRTVMLSMEVDDLEVIHLDTSLQECLASVNLRRQARDATLPPVDPHHTESKYRGVLSSVQRLRANGVTVHTLNRAQAEAHLVSTLFPLLS